MTDLESTAAAPYKDDDLVYVDPDTRTVVGLVAWNENGSPKKLARPPREFPAAPGAAPVTAVVPATDDDDEPAAAPPAAAGAPAPAKGPAPRGRGRPVRQPRVRYYPWGTYRSMKRIFKVAGKVHEIRGQASLDDVLPKALAEAFWDDTPAAGSAPAPVDQASDQY